ncbi:ABC transporter permease [Rhizobium ruizarguesonis]
MRWIMVPYLSYLAAPVVLLMIGSFGESWTNSLLPTGVTGRWYLEIWADRSFRRAFSTSLTVCAATCIVSVLIAVPFAYAIHGAASRRVRAAVRILYLLPIAAPPLVLGFGFILVFSSNSLPFLGASWLLVVGHVVLALPYLMQVLVADMRHLDLDTLEAAAESLGAGFVSRFFHIVLPSLRHSLVAGIILVATLSIGEFQLTNLIAGFLTRTYPVVLLQAFYGATGFACAATVVLLLLALLGAAGSAVAGREAAA